MNAMSTQGTTQSSGGSRMSFLADAEQAADSLQTRKQSFNEQFASLDRRFQDLDKIKDAKERGVREAILTAELDKLHAAGKAEEEDLGNAVFGLNTHLEELGQEYVTLDSSDPVERQMIADAEANLESARKNWIWFLRESAVKRATAHFEATKQKVAEMARARLMKKDMKGSLQHILALSNKVSSIIKGRISVIDNQIRLVGQRRIEALRIKEAAVKVVDELDVKLEKVKDDLRVAEEMLVPMTNPVERAQQETRISDLKTLFENIKAERNGAFVVVQSKEKFSIALETAEQTHINLKASLNMWYQGLKSDTEERVRIFEARLEAKKALADQRAVETLDQISSVTDQRSVEELAKIAAASERLAMNKIETMPQRILDMDTVRQAQKEAQAQIMERMARALDTWKSKYGMNPMETRLRDDEAA